MSQSALVDLTKVAISSNGSGALVLGSAVPGFRGVEALTDGAVYSYSIQQGDLYEVGTGTYIQSTRTLTRSPVWSSSGGSVISLPANTAVSFTVLSSDLEAISVTNEAVEAAAQAIAAAQQATAEAMSATASAASAAQSAAQANTGQIVVASADAIAALGSNYKTAFLNQAGRAGLFSFVSGNFSALVAADTLRGLAVAPSSDTSGASGAWLRVWDGIKGRPEWFGAVGYSDYAFASEGVTPFANDPTVDSGANTRAIDACVSLCPITLLGPLFYYVDKTVAIGIDNRKIIGTRKGNEIATKGTTAIVLRGANAATMDVVLLGKPADFSPPGGPVAGWVNNPAISDLSVMRTVPPAGASAGSEALGPAGIRQRWAVQPEVERVFALNHSTGFYWGATVYTKMDWCHSYRDNTGSVPANDFYIGFFIDGNFALGSTYAGGNGSVNASHLKSGHIAGGGAGVNIGYLLTGFADTFGENWETYGSPRHGCWIIGNSGFNDLGVRTRANGDLHLNRLILDNAGEACLKITNVTAWASIDISDIYAAIAGSSSQSAVVLQQNSGSITFSGGELIGTGNLMNGGSAYGFAVTDTPNLVIDSAVKIVGMAQPVVLVNAVGGDIAPVIYKPYIAAVGNGAFPAVALRSNANGPTRRLTIRPIITTPFDGSAPPSSYRSYTDGVNIPTTADCTFTEINGSGIDNTNLNNKISFNGAGVAAQGLISGSTGVYVTGVPV